MSEQNVPGGERSRRLGDVEIDPVSGRVSSLSGRFAAVELSPLEGELLAYLVDRDGSVVAKRDLLRDVWRYAHKAKTRTVDVTLARIRRKLECTPIQLETVWGRGVTFSVSPEARLAVGTPLDPGLVDLLVRFAKQPFRTIPHDRIDRGRAEALRASLSADGGGGRLLDGPEGWIWLPKLYRQQALPSPATPYQRRPIEEATLNLMLDEGWRCISVFGLAGMGASRMVVEVLRQRAERVSYVDLHGCIDTAELERRLCDQLGVGESSEAVETALTAQASILCLDGLHWSASGLIGRLSRTTQVVLTGRGPQKVRGEAILPVPPMRPEEAERLLVSRLTAAGTTLDSAEVARLVQQLDGHPALIEQVALQPWRTHELPHRDPDAPVPEQTTQKVTAQIRRTVDTLGPETRRVLACLSLLRRGLTGAQVERWLGPDVQEHLQRLRRAALIVERPLCRVNTLVRQNAAGERATHRVSLHQWMREEAVRYMAELAHNPRATLTRLAVLEEMEAHLDDLEGETFMDVAYALAWAVDNRFGPGERYAAVADKVLQRHPNHVRWRAMSSATHGGSSAGVIAACLASEDPVDRLHGLLAQHREHSGTVDLDVAAALANVLPPLEAVALRRVCLANEVATGVCSVEELQTRTTRYHLVEMQRLGSLSVLLRAQGRVLEALDVQDRRIALARQAGDLGEVLQASAARAMTALGIAPLRSLVEMEAIRAVALERGARGVATHLGVIRGLALAALGDAKASVEALTRHGPLSQFCGGAYRQVARLFTEIELGYQAGDLTLARAMQERSLEELPARVRPWLVLADVWLVARAEGWQEQRLVAEAHRRLPDNALGRMLAVLVDHRSVQAARTGKK